jgi:hypothetical protein
MDFSVGLEPSAASIIMVEECAESESVVQKYGDFPLPAISSFIAIVSTFTVHIYVGPFFVMLLRPHVSLLVSVQLSFALGFVFHPEDGRRRFL